jgi:hypothetical protein
MSRVWSRSFVPAIGGSSTAKRTSSSPSPPPARVVEHVDTRERRVDGYTIDSGPLVVQLEPTVERAHYLRILLDPADIAPTGPGTVGFVRRIAVVLVVALPLAAADLLWKHFEPTPSWAYHTRSPAWLLLSIGLVFGAMAAARVPSVAVRLAAGVMAGGVLGNALSAAWNDLRVPNPIIASWGQAIVAFNVADVFTTIGTLALTATLALSLIRHSDNLPTRAEARAMWARALQRRV